LAPIVTKALLALMSSQQEPWYFDIAPDIRVLAFTAGVAVLATILTGIAPAIRSTGRELEQRIREGSGTRRAAERRNVFPRVLLVCEISLAFVLVAGAGLVGFSIVRLHEIPTGFDARHLMLFPLDMNKQQRKDDALASNYREIAEGLSQLPE
jgi:putative ABC transport system permease protein